MKLNDSDIDRAIKLGKSSLAAFYDSRQGDLQYDCDHLEKHLRSLLERNGFPSLEITCKPKELKSALQKIERKCLDAESGYADRILDGIPAEDIMTDLVRGRITCHFSDQIDMVAQQIKKHFTVIPDFSEDHQLPTRFAEFGYHALHLIFEPPTMSGGIQTYFSDRRIEIQIRSALMDIWSVVNWDIGYKSGKEVAPEIKRRLAGVSALFYLVDREFMGIRDDAVLSQEVPDQGIDS